MATNNTANVPRGGKTKWTSMSISQLISVYKHVKARHDKDVRFWTRVQSEMDDAGFLYSISECKIKWAQLLRTYNENRSKKATWSHFEEMDEIYQGSNESKADKTKITFYFKTKKPAPSSPSE